MKRRGGSESAWPDRLRQYWLALGLCASAVVSWPLTAAEDSRDEFDSLLAPLLALAGTDSDGSVPNALQAVSAALRTRLEADLGTALPACPEYDPLQGVVISREATTEDLSTEVHPLIERLGALLDQKDAALRDGAAYVLGEIGPLGAPVVSPRATGLGDRPMWLTHAAGRTRCEQWSMSGSLAQLPKPLRQRAETHTQHRQWPLLLAADLLGDVGRIWPDGLISSLLDNDDNVVPLGTKPKLEPPPALNPEMAAALLDLAAVASDSARGIALRLEVLVLLSQAKALGPAAAPLRTLMAHANDPISFAAARTLISSQNPHMVEAIVLLLKRHQLGLWETQPDLFCAQIIADPELLRILTDRLQGEDWGEAKQAAIWLACTRSQQAPPALLAALTHPSWEVVQAAIEALAAWLDKDAAVRAALAEVAKAHWSGLVRAQARQALDGPEGPPEPDRPESDDQVMVVLGGCFHRCLTDHLNAVCGVDGEVVDGIYQSPRLGQFQVVWQRARRNPAPMGFPIVLSEDLDRTAYGTSSYLTVDDGWLVGTDRWHYDGVIGHVSHAGEVQPIGELGEDAAAILDTPQLGRIVLGGSVFGLGKGGLLASIHAGEEGWSMRYRASLPSPPWAWAFAPDGTLLVADPHNAVAVHADWSLEALSCPTIVPASMPKRVLSVARRAADSPLPVRHREAVVRVAVLEPIVERRRLALLQSHNGPQQGESGQPLECIQEDYQDVVQELVDAKQHQGDSAGALALLDESLCDADAINVGQRANLLADLGRPQEALAYLQAHPYVEQYVAQFLLTALALIEGDSNAARKHLDRAQNALDGESIPGLFEPDRRYADMLSLIVNPSNTVFASTPELDQGGWPEPLMRYLQGEISEAQLVPELYRRDGQVDRERLCEALVYLGMREAATGRHVHSRRYFRAAVRLSVYDFMEHTVALLALSRE